MNMNSNASHEFQQQLDRLVDGELSKAEYDDLLRRLDNEPDGWRNCAMAFLEAQALQQEFGSLIVSREDEQPAVTLKNRPDSSEQHKSASLVRLSLAMAASFLVGFVGFAWWQSTQSSNDGNDASHDNLSHIAQEDNGSGEELSNERRAPTFAATTDRDNQLVDRLIFVVDQGDGRASQFELPIYDASHGYAQQLLRDAPSIPRDVEQAIRNSGLRVESQRQWAPVRLQDGRRVVFPIDQLDIRPVSNNTYY